MRNREARKPVMIVARMRVGARWLDARILNISSRGLMLHADDPPPLGSYLELRRGAHTIVARVMWSGDERVGVMSQDAICADELIRDLPPTSGAQAGEERRAAPRTTVTAHEASRWHGRSMKFAAVALLGMALGAGVIGAVENMSGQPMARVEAALR